jgi:hypothetical protein
MTRQQKAEREEALIMLHKFIQPGNTIYTILRHVSRSGMSRVIDLYQTRGEPQWLSGYASRVGLGRFDCRRQGIRVGGCGMDMGFHLVYNLSYILFPNGFDCIGEDNRCPSNDHSNGDRNYSPDNRHKDGGYALRHRWL